jgi:hypothetical protein
VFAGTLQHMETFAVNLIGKAKRATFGGREFYVAPASLITPGILSGSRGPLLYLPEEVSRDPAVWNHVPIVVKHPYVNGEPVSARDPDVLEKQGVGFVFRSQFKEKLTAEAWIDIANAQRIEPRIIAALEKGQPMELSTGLFVRNDPAPEGATHNGRSYSFIARDLKPDHLALLPDEIGACSVKDGCGLLVHDDERKSILRKLGEWLGVVNATANEPTHDELRRRLQELVEKRFGSGGMGMTGGPSCYVADVYDSEAIYENGGKTFRIGYTTDLRTGKVDLVEGPPEEVRRQTVYKPVANAMQECPECGAKVPEDADECDECGYNLTANEEPRQYTRDAEGKFAKEGGGKKKDGKDKDDDKDEKKEDPDAIGQSGVSKLDEFGSLNPPMVGDSDPDEPRKKKPTRNEGEPAMTRVETIQWLTTNCSCWAGQKAELDKLPDPVLANLKGSAEKAKADEQLATNAAKAFVVDGQEFTWNAAASKWESKQAKVATVPPVAPPARTLTDAEWLASAPAGVQGAVRNAMEIEQREKAALAAQLQQVAERTTDPHKKAFIANELQANPKLERLREMLLLAGDSVPAQQHTVYPSYAGQFGGMPTLNAKDDSQNLFPEITVNFDEMASPALRRKQTA